MKETIIKVVSSAISIILTVISALILVLVVFFPEILFIVVVLPDLTLLFLILGFVAIKSRWYFPVATMLFLGASITFIYISKIINGTPADLVSFVAYYVLINLLISILIHFLSGYLVGLAFDRYIKFRKSRKENA